MSDIFNGKGVEVRLIKDDDFLKIRETLTRIGIASKNSDTLYQSCHILHKQGRYSIIHFKELFELDGKSSNFSEEDKARRNVIARLLDEWDLVEILDPSKISESMGSLSQVKIIPFKEKNRWELVSKYNVGKKIR